MNTPGGDEPLPVRAGDVIAGRYRVEGVIGVGGMGVVVAGTHLDLDQRVAIKLIQPSVMNDEALRERFIREARAAARLRSTHVAKVLDVGKLLSGAPYMVMELLEGCDLGALVARNGRLPAETAADFIAQACEAVAEAHANGIIHRDIKPQNLFLTSGVGGGALVKVLDFGVSKVSIAGLESLTKSMMVVGSPLYMSPEQMRSSRDVDARTDVWALGAVLFELLSGHAPFAAESVPALCLKVAGEAPPPLGLERPDLPPALVGVVMRCLAKRPDDRFRDAGELAAALAPFVTPASSLTIARARMASSGMRRTHASDAPLVTDKGEVAGERAPERRVHGGAVAAIAFAASLCVAAIIVGSSWVRGQEAPQHAARPFVASLKLPEPVQAPPEPAPPASASASAAPPVAPPKPPPRVAPKPPPKPVANDDDIPSMR